MLELELLGATELDLEFETLEAALGNPEAFLRADAAPIVSQAVRQNFLQGGRPVTWTDITAKSRAQRKVNKTSGPLIDTEALMNAASAGEEGVAGSVFGVEGDTLTEGTDLVQAKVLNDGWKDKNIPARPFEQIEIQDEVRLKDSYEGDYLHQLLARWN